MYRCTRCIVSVLVTACDNLFHECACISGASGSGVPRESAVKYLAQIRTASRGIAVDRDTSFAKTSYHRPYREEEVKGKIRRLGWRGEKVASPCVNAFKVERSRAGVATNRDLPEVGDAISDKLKSSMLLVQSV
jgi:hypothetical protein